MNCETCRHSIGCDVVTAQKFRTMDYQIGKGGFNGGIGLVCEKRRIIAPTPCADYEREPGSGG